MKITTINSIYLNSFIAIKMLKRLGLQEPTHDQIYFMSSLLSDVDVIFLKPALNKQLSQQEHACLYWTAKGKTRKQIGELLDLKPDTVKGYQDRAKDKLGCQSLPHAVYEAFKFGYLFPNGKFDNR